MSLYEAIANGTEKLAVIGLGYVGLPLAAAFARKGVKVIGYDLNAEKISLYQSGVDPTGEVGDEAVRQTTVAFTADEARLEEAKFHIIAVPTPVKTDRTPDLAPIIRACELLGRHLSEGSVVVLESTVYPGVTEDVCVPILEKQSGLACGAGFRIGYSPERINPGDPVHRLENIRKIVSGMDTQALDEIAGVYSLVVEAGTYRVSSIKVAETIKVVENSQRDINIAFMNEVAMALARMGIDTAEVIDGMNTKWNALGFRPGLVGGHCIGADPCYFTYEAERLGYHSQIIRNGRIVNDGMGTYIAEAAIRQLVLAGKKVREAVVVVLGLTFKENCPDIRNSRVVDILDRLKEYGVQPAVADPLASPAEASGMYHIELSDLAEVRNADCIIIAVAHDLYKALDAEALDRLFGEKQNDGKVILDVKSVLDRKSLEAAGYRYWSL